MALSKLAEEAKKLNDEDFRDLVTELLRQGRSPDLIKNIKTDVIREAKHVGRKQGIKPKQPGRFGVSKERHTAEWPASQVAGSSTESSQSAFKSPMIFRGDLIPDSSFVFFDVEKLSLQKDSSSGKHEQVASSVAVANRESNIVLWAFIKWSRVCQTFPTLTGITNEKLKIGVDIGLVKPLVLMSCAGNTIVGWDLKNDLLALFVNDQTNTLDLTDYFQDDKGKMKLKDVWEELCGKKETASFQCGVHSAIQDARATRDVFLKMQELRKQYPKSSKCPVLISRSPRGPFKNDPSDICRCAKNKFKKPKQTVFFNPSNK